MIDIATGPTAARPEPDPGATPSLAGRGPLAPRLEAGRKARNRTPRAALGDAGGTQRDAIELLEASNVGRVPELVPIRHGRMLASPFAFYRGAAPIMAYDLSRLPHSGITVQLCGDAHLANFGLFASPERRVLFGPNDFDETLPGPFDWDVRRLAASFVIAARERGFPVAQQRAGVRILCATFREEIARCAKMAPLEVWYSQFTAANLLARARTAEARAHEASVVGAARKRDWRTTAEHATHIVDGELRIRDAPPLVYHHRDISSGAAERFDAAMRSFFEQYRATLLSDRCALFDRYRLVDGAIRVVGVGSVGTRCYIALFVADGVSPLIVQVKEARASALEAYLPRSRYPNHGQRVVAGQRLLQSASDVFLGWSRAKPAGFDYYVRQLRDMKGSFDVESFSRDDLDEYAEACAIALARGMAKAGDPALIAGYVGKSRAFDRAMERFALAYADHNEADWSAFRAAVKAGRIEASSA
jgi:uncharacterized protein (DUF2252 family)